MDIEVGIFCGTPLAFGLLLVEAWSNLKGRSVEVWSLAKRSCGPPRTSFDRHPSCAPLTFSQTSLTVPRHVFCTVSLSRRSSRLSRASPPASTLPLRSQRRFPSRTRRRSRWLRYRGKQYHWRWKGAEAVIGPETDARAVPRTQVDILAECFAFGERKASTHGLQGKPANSAAR